MRGGPRCAPAPLPARAPPPPAPSLRVLVAPSFGLLRFAPRSPSGSAPSPLRSPPPGLWGRYAPLGPLRGPCSLRSAAFGVARRPGGGAAGPPLRARPAFGGVRSLRSAAGGAARLRRAFLRAPPPAAFLASLVFLRFAPFALRAFCPLRGPCRFRVLAPFGAHSSAPLPRRGGFVNKRKEIRPHQPVSNHKKQASESSEAPNLAKLNKTHPFV